MAPPTRRRRPATSFLFVLLAQRATTFAPRPRLAAPRHRHTLLASSSKPLPDSNIPGLTRDKDDLPGESEEEDAAAVEVLESTTEAAVAEAPAAAKAAGPAAGRGFILRHS